MTYENRKQGWDFSGDINLEYGGSYIKLDSGYAEYVRVTDLDSGIGFTGACMIERGTVPFIRGIRKHIKSALAMYSQSIRQLPGLGIERADRWHYIARALMEYGFEDNDSRETVQMESDGPMQFDGWKADKRLTGTGIRAYVESLHDCAE